MSESVLLIGNGLNRASDKKAWVDILGNLHKQYLHEEPETYENKPLEFEDIVLRSIATRSGGELEIKERIAELTGEPFTSDLIKTFTSLNVKHILTTNYDYNLEFSMSSDFDENTYKSSSETKYSLMRHYPVNDRRIWHIHGEQKIPQSICIGFYQYGSYLSRIHDYLTTPKDNPRIQDFLKKGKKDDIESWPLLFFSHDIHIVGLTLSFVETDLWWLLNYRRHLMLEHPEYGISNKIHYYYPDGQCHGDQISLMDSMGIELHPCTLIRKNWTKLYEDIYNQVESAINESAKES